jgi:hypothetical protein
LLSGNISGIIQYYSEDTDESTGQFWGISPKVGDYFRISFDETAGNNEEYTVTKVVDKDLTIAGISPLLSRYMYKMNVVRRDYNYEVNTASPSASMEQWTSDVANIVNTSEEVQSDTVFNYDTTVDQGSLSGDGSYGGYGN